jgi:signal transduction histidine kinase/CheY-like chemotaxis protein/HPt (histidine-containing phosphotransfer) domain-containing protein
MTIMIVLLVLGSSVFLSFISYQRARKSLVAQLEDNYGVAAQKYALELTSWINTNATIIDTMAAEIAVNDITLEDYDAFHSYLKHSNELLNKNGYVYDVYFTYPNNTMVCASDFIADGTVDFVHEREWYTTSALTGETFFSTPYLDSDTQRSVITISKAVYKDDQLLGVLAADIFVDVLVDMIEDANVAEDSYAFLIDQNMRMVVHPNDAYDYEDYPLTVMGVEGSPYGPLIEAIHTGSDEMVYVTDYDGVKRGIVYSRMTNTGWYVCIATSKNEVEEGVVNLVLGFIIATVISIVISVAVAIVLARVLDRLNKQEQEYKQQMLRLEKQAADEASEAKSRFLADMSHEIRTPINAIIGMNEMIIRETDNKDILGYSQNIKQSGHNLLQLINGILDFSKIEDGKMEIVPVRYSVSSQIAYLINSISDRANSKKLEFNVSVDRNIPSELYGDDTRINQVIINLLTNAVKYTKKGSVDFTIRELERKDGNIKLYFEVKDTGIGIKETDMEKLFESFERLDVVKNRNIEGTGLGMTITVKLLELMDSELKVESVYGEGSTFSFDLWQKIENEEPLGDYREAINKPQETEAYKESFRAPDARILVVDDTKMNLLVVENLLKKTGIKIDTALNGPDSVELAKNNAYDVILMDQRMPGMDGTEAMNEIKNLDNKLNVNTPVICLTADVVRGAKERYLQMGFNDYLTKPIDSAKLEKMLIEYLPADKTEIVEKDAKSESAEESESELKKALKRNGVDVNIGIAFTGDDEDMYMSLLGEYAAEEAEKSANIKECYRTKDWKNYGVYVHSLKSTSKMIGASALAEIAAESEAASNVQDTLVIDSNHDRMMEMYSVLADVIRENIGSDTVSVSQNDDEILEFLPEE